MVSGASRTSLNIMSNLVADHTATMANSVGCTQDPDSEANSRMSMKGPTRGFDGHFCEICSKFKTAFRRASFLNQL